jgi:hypothetical protein
MFQFWYVNFTIPIILRSVSAIFVMPLMEITTSLGFKIAKEYTGAPIIFGRCPSMSANESEPMLRTYLVCREKQEREREKQANST